MIDYTIDMKTWRCGVNSHHRLGIGSTKMINKEGYKCCLGQFVGWKNDEDITGAHITPADVAIKVDRIYDPLFVQYRFNNYIDTALSQSLMQINDCEDTTYLEKLIEISNKLNEYDATLKIVNYLDFFTEEDIESLKSNKLI